MFLSKTQMVRLLSMAAIVISLWSMWKRFDAIIDNWHEYYDVALGQQIIKDMFAEDKKQFKDEWDAFNKDFNGTKDKGINSKPAVPGPGSEADRYAEYNAKSLVKPVPNTPVPQRADEMLRGYYTGLWNFIVRTGLGHVFLGVILVGIGGFLIRLVFRKMTDDKINKGLKLIGLG